jgi:CRISPR-associated protein Cas1
MANNHIISIEKPAKLSVDISRIEILFSQTNEKHYFVPSDIAVLILAHHTISLSSAGSKELSKAGAVIIYVGGNFMPCGITLPVGTNLAGSKRPHQQAKYINTPIPKHWWRQIIKAKILGQASTLAEISKENAQRLIAIADKVSEGDVENKEGQAARYYWEIYFKKLNSNNGRVKEGATDLINSCLNYSYAIIRSIVARSLVSAGLCLNFGVGHIRKDNPFNLVEDFIEPFRYIADKVVFDVYRCHANATRQSNPDFVNDIIPLSLNSKIKKQLLSGIVNSVVKIQNKNYRLFEAIDFAVLSFCDSLGDPRKNLLLPNMQKARGVKAELSEKNIWSKI